MTLPNRDDLRIVVREDFSRFPAGRFRTDGPYSGQRFREDLLAPRITSALAKKTHVRVVLDGTRGYGSSFLEEAFGGLVRDHEFSARDLVQSLKLDTSDDSLRAEILDYIKAAGEIASKR